MRHDLRHFGPGSAVASILLAGLLTCACQETSVEQVGWDDVPCFPYGAPDYQGNYAFDGTLLPLTVTAANGACCAAIGGTLEYVVLELTESRLEMAMEGMPNRTWYRESGQAGNIVGAWLREGGPDYTFLDDRSFTAAGDPNCSEYLCAAVPGIAGASPTAKLASQLYLLLPAAVLLIRKRRGRGRRSARAPEREAAGPHCTRFDPRDAGPMPEAPATGRMQTPGNPT